MPKGLRNNILLYKISNLKNKFYFILNINN